MHPFVGLIAVSVVTGVVMLVIFGRTTNQAALRRVKGRIVASIIEIWLFKDRPGLMFGSAARVLRHNLNYLRYSLVAVVFVIVPVVLIMVQLGIRYAHRPLEPSEEVIVSATLASGASVLDADLSLVAPEGLVVMTPALRIEETGEVDWRIRAETPGTYEIYIKGPNSEVSKTIVVENSIIPFAPVRSKALSWDFFLYPAEKPLPKDSAVKSIRVSYPPARLNVAGLNLHWLIVFFVVSVAAGFALKGVFRVEV
jgi:hypothetical protein